MHRVELKGVQTPHRFLSFLVLLFLMHRVELKVRLPTQAKDIEIDVPNAPCGVESRVEDGEWKVSHKVPNAPCGVERQVPKCVQSSLLVRS